MCARGHARERGGVGVDGHWNFAEDRRGKAVRVQGGRGTRLHRVERGVPRGVQGCLRVVEEQEGGTRHGHW